MSWFPEFSCKQISFEFEQRGPGTQHSAGHGIRDNNQLAQLPGTVVPSAVSFLSNGNYRAVIFWAIHPDFLPEVTLITLDQT
jgi:hypothetical protein